MVMLLWGCGSILVVPIGPPCWVSTHWFHPFVLTQNLLYSSKFVGENDRIWGDICVCFGMWSHIRCPYRGWGGYNPIWVVPIGPPCWVSTHRFHPFVLTPNLFYSTESVGENNRIWGDICVSFGMEGI